MSKPSAKRMAMLTRIREAARQERLADEARARHKDRMRHQDRVAAKARREREAFERAKARKGVVQPTPRPPLAAPQQSSFAFERWSPEDWREAL